MFPHGTVLSMTLSDTAVRVMLLGAGELDAVIRVCRQCPSVAEAGRRLYDVSRLQKSSNNDSHRLGAHVDTTARAFAELLQSL